MDGLDVCIAALDDLIASLIAERAPMVKVDQYIALRKFLTPRKRSRSRQRFTALLMFMAWATTHVDGFDEQVRKSATMFYQRSLERGVIPVGIRH